MDEEVGMTVVVLVTDVLGLWLYFFPSYSWHQKMMVEVEVEGQIYSGASVVAMGVEGIPKWIQLRNARRLDMRGEAVVVELPDDRYMFLY